MIDRMDNYFKGIGKLITETLKNAAYLKKLYPDSKVELT